MNQNLKENDLTLAFDRSVQSLQKMGAEIARAIDVDRPSESPVAGVGIDVLLAKTSREVMTALNLSGRILAEVFPANHEERLAYYKRDQSWVRLMNEHHQTKSWLMQWNQVQQLVRKMADRKRLKLYPKSERFEPGLHSQLTVYDEVFDNLRGVLNPHKQNADAKEAGSFPDVPLPHSVFMAHIHAAYRVLLAQGKDPSRAKFIDVGCGAGLKVLTAAKYFRYCYGLELDAGYAQAARDLFEATGAEDCDVIEGNALHFDSYDVFDVIYAYRPISDNALMVELEKWITSRSGKSGILIAPYDLFSGRCADYDCEQIDGRLYLLGDTKAAATRLRRKAEWVGPHTTDYRPALSGAWDEIIEVSRGRGYALSPRISTVY